MVALLGILQHHKQLTLPQHNNNHNQLAVALPLHYYQVALELHLLLEAATLIAALPVAVLLVHHILLRLLCNSRNSLLLNLLPPNSSSSRLNFPPAVAMAVAIKQVEFQTQTIMPE
jgi:hypothetical protein